MGSHSLPFGIEYVTDMLGITRRTGAASADSWYADCPFCGRRKKFNVNVQKDTFHCPACGEGGGMLQLYAKVRDVTVKESAKELLCAYEGAGDEIRKSISMRRQEIAGHPERTPAAPLERRDAAYKKLVSVLSLQDYHRESLKKRGLPDQMINILKYRSTPQQDLKKIVSDLLKTGADLEGIPGFYGRNVKKIVRRKPGILIPVKTLWGYISGFQIRYDNLPETASMSEKERYRKYTWFYSADKKDGVSAAGCENIHHAGFCPGTCIERVCLTEGVLKADIAAYISKMPFIGLTGVSNTGRLGEELDALKALGTREVYICLDMDYQTNPNVARAMKKITGICRNSRLMTTVVTWPEEFKGIDDFLVFKRSRGFI